MSGTFPRGGSEMLEEAQGEQKSHRPTQWQMATIVAVLAVLGAFYFYLLHEALFNQIKF